MNMKKARQAEVFAHTLGADSLGRPTRVWVPGSEGVGAVVKIARVNGIQCECLRVPVLGGTPEPCPASFGKSPCYHVLAALLYVAHQTGQALQFVGPESERGFAVQAGAATFKAIVRKKAEKKRRKKAA